MQQVNFNIDTWVINVKGKLPEELAERLQQLQEMARDEESEIPSDWSFQGQTLYIRPHGSGRQWRWILYAKDGLHLDIGKGKLNGSIAKVRFPSLLLHEHGPGKALTLVYYFLVELFGEDFTLQVSEVHLCVDIAGWELSLDDAQRFVSRGRSKAARLYENEDEQEAMQLATPLARITGRRCTEYKFSQTAPHSCDVYDKTLEVRVHHKQWFHEIWKQQGWDGESQVTRVEFRYARDCLREMGIDDPYDMLDLVPQMWAYSTQKWLRHTQPNGDLNQSRWPLSSVWQVVQSASWGEDATPIIRQKKVELDADRAKAGFVGFATSWAVREAFLYQCGIKSESGRRLGVPLHVIDEDGAGFLVWAYDPVQKYLQERKEMTFAGVMLDKAQQLGIELAA
jgi:hypothetical protein